jgi:hypothetical protein
MMRGVVNAKDARENTITKQNIHDEIYNIERQIRNFSSSNYRELRVDFTKATNKNVLQFTNIDSFDLDNDTINIDNHDFNTNDIVQFSSTGDFPEPLLENKFYGVIVVDENNIQLYEYDDIFQTPIVLDTQGSGIVKIRKLIASELYYRSWKEFYTFPFAESYINILEFVEEHFRKQGFTISRLENPETKTIFWKIRW